MATDEHVETVIIGGGQAGLAVGYHLRTQGRAFVILDGSERVGDSWRRRWPSLRLYSPASFDGLPGMAFPAPAHSYPTGLEMADYLQSYAKRFGYGVVREFTGHGIGSWFHSGLIIPHFDTPHFDTPIEAGMTFTVEPMLTLGTHEWDMWPDNWTVTTRDKSRCAQFEHTILVTNSGAEILTLP